MERHTESVSRHYDAEGIATAILDALERAGKPPGSVTIDDLAPADEVHTRGREATRELAALAMSVDALHPDARVLDVGSGIGGPARFLAATSGCQVTGVDLTPGFCTAATQLTAAVGLQDRVRFHCGSALDMPFEDQRFDLVWTVQMQMNIADKAALYGEIARVLKPGGHLVFQDLVAGEREGLILPVPWASDPSHSFLVDAASLRQTIIESGLREVLWRDLSEMHRERNRAQAAKPKPAERPPVGIHQVLGPDAFEKRRNASQCLQQGRIGFVQGLFRKPGAETAG